MGVSRVPPPSSIVDTQNVKDIESENILDSIIDELRIMNFYNQLTHDTKITTEEI
jgi:hypothetical protein